MFDIILEVQTYFLLLLSESIKWIKTSSVCSICSKHVCSKSVRLRRFKSSALKCQIRRFCRFCNQPQAYWFCNISDVCSVFSVFLCSLMFVRLLNARWWQRAVCVYHAGLLWCLERRVCTKTCVQEGDVYVSFLLSYLTTGTKYSVWNLTSALTIHHTVRLLGCKCTSDSSGDAFPDVFAPAYD